MTQDWSPICVKQNVSCDEFLMLQQAHFEEICGFFGKIKLKNYYSFKIYAKNLRKCIKLICHELC